MKEYIEREAALNFEAEITAAPTEIQAISQGMALYAEHIKAIPTADVAPVVHAEWIENDNGTWSCGRCHSWIPNEQHFYARYCLHCGAKMDGGEKNEHTD